MQELADFLSGSRSLQPVLDKTGLEGRYRINLRFSTFVSPDSQQAVDPELEPALVRQLGLRLVKYKGPGKVMIVDHFEPPTGN